MTDKNSKILHQKLGEFLVEFERLIYAIKYLKLIPLCGLSDQAEILVIPYTAKQTIDVFNAMIDLATKRGILDKNDEKLYRALIKDLEDLNTQRNKIIHSLWTTTSYKEKDNKHVAIQFKKFKALQYEKIEITEDLLDKIINKTKTLNSIIHTVGTLEGLIFAKPTNKLSDCWKREDGDWVDLRTS